MLVAVVALVQSVTTHHLESVEMVALERHHQLLAHL
jgi:hypothetical protein